MATTKKTITEGAVKQMIEETAKYMKAKNDIWAQAVELEGKLKSLNEGHRGFAASFGFDVPGDTSNVTKTGFVQDNGPISNLTSLGAEIQAAVAEETAKAEEAKAMNEDVMTQLQELRAELAELKASKK